MSSPVAARLFLEDLFQEAVQAALPSSMLAEYLPAKPKGRCVVIGAGKASAAMASALEAAWPDVNLSGVVVTRYDHAVSCKHIRILQAAHPVPDVNSLRAADDILGVLENLSSDDLVIALISGGGSSLLAKPKSGMSLQDKQIINKALLRSGATIEEMNVVRQVFSQVKGGKLAQAAEPAQLVALVISDVPGDTPAHIASGPTVPVFNSIEQAREILTRYEIDLPHTALAVLDDGGEVPYSPSALKTDIRMIATPLKSLKAAAACAKDKDIRSIILGDAVEGEAKDVGKVMSAIALSTQKHSLPLAPPAVILSGGETSVTIGPKGGGRGGRNTEFLLSLAVALRGAMNIYAIACDTDGIDGTEDAAGAIITPDTLDRGRQMGLDARAYLSRHDSYSYFKALGDLIISGPTLTNVNDFRAIYVAGPDAHS